MTAAGVSLPTYESHLAEIAESDDRIVVLTAENRASIRGLAERLGDRFIDVGIAEQTLVGVAAGLARMGRIPVVHGLAAFLTMRAFEFIRTDAGLARLPVKLVGSIPGVLSEANGPTHQALEDVGLMRLVPGMTIFAPADRDDLMAGLTGAVLHPRPTYIRLTERPAGVVHDPEFRMGIAETLVDGDDVAILAYGYLVTEAVEAARRLAREGIATRVVNLRTLAPIDERALEKALDAALCVTVEDHGTTGGLASIVAEAAVRRGGAVEVVSIGLPPNGFAPGTVESVLRRERLSGAALADRIRARYRPKGA